jgi:hypothetical protein
LAKPATPVVDPDAHRLSAEFSGNHQVQIPIAIDVPGGNVKAASGVTVCHFKRGPRLPAQEHLDLVAIHPVHQAARFGEGYIGAAIAIKVGYARGAPDSQGKTGSPGREGVLPIATWQSLRLRWGAQQQANHTEDAQSANFPRVAGFWRDCHALMHILLCGSGREKVMTSTKEKLSWPIKHTP